MTFSAEQVLYWAVWLFGVLYSLCRFCHTVDGLKNIITPLDFVDGWTFLERKKDVSDIEWAVLTDAFKNYYMLLLLHVIFSQTGYLKRKKVILPFHAIYSVTCLILVVGPFISALYVAYMFIMYAVQITRRKSFCYGITVVSLYLLQQEQIIKLREAIAPEKNTGFLSDVGFVWLIARCLSFSVDRINAGNHYKVNLEDLLIVVSYCFYVPTVFIGPLLTYDSYLEQVSHPNRNKPFSFKSLLHFLHPICGLFILEFMLHYVYSSVQFYPEIVANFDTWSLCGLGYALPTLFFLKYFVIYSFSGALAKMEQIELPPPPKCISRVNAPSTLWRTFDRGLYLWLLKYVYFPAMGGKWTWLRKIFALALSFAFICIWHGMDRAVCAWTVLNFINVIFEKLTLLMMSTKKGNKKSEMLLSIVNRKRLKFMIATPHFIIMCISSCFFLSNWDIGLLMFKRIIFGGWIPLLTTVCIMYCGCCVASDVREWEESKGKLLK